MTLPDALLGWAAGFLAVVLAFAVYAEAVDW